MARVQSGEELNAHLQRAGVGPAGCRTRSSVFDISANGKCGAVVRLSATDLSGVWNVKKSPDTDYLGWTFSKEEPPMTPWAEERFKLTRPSFGPRSMADSNDPVNPTTLGAAGCFPPGMPRLYLQPFPMEIIQLPGRVIEFFEYSHFVRQIFTDGRKHNTDLGSTWLGDAIGTWEGDTLVVDTIGFNDKTWLDRAGHPHSADMHLTERLRRVDQNTLTIDVKDRFRKPIPSRGADGLPSARIPSGTSWKWLAKTTPTTIRC